MPALTRAQRDALVVLAQFPDRYLEGWKRRSTVERVPRVNMRAAGALARMRLVDAQWPMYLTPSSVYVHETRYRINDAGQQALAAC